MKSRRISLQGDPDHYHSAEIQTGEGVPVDQFLRELGLEDRGTAPRARRDLISVRRYIAKDNPAAADRTLQRIRRAVDNLSLIPELECPWEGGSTRGLSVASVSYRVKDDVISVQTVGHTSPLLPKLDSE